MSANKSKSVYGRACRAAVIASLGMSHLFAALPVHAQTPNSTILEAREAFRKKDRTRLAAARAVATASRLPLAQWTEYWDLNARIAELQQPEVDAFYARWPGSYVEDRFRNDWLLELGKRRDWANFAVDFPRFRMNDDREVSCYALLVDHLNGKPVKEAAQAAWLNQSSDDTGCALMASTLYAAGQFTAADVWRKARFAIDANRPASARQAVSLLGAAEVNSVENLINSPIRFLAREARAARRSDAELAALALMRLAVNDASGAAVQLDEKWDKLLPADLAAWAWATVGKRSAMALSPEASQHFHRALLLTQRKGQDKAVAADWPQETLAWQVRAALRADNGTTRWAQVMQGIEAMAPDEQRDPAWVYWKARGLQAAALDAPPHAELLRSQARELLESIAGQLHFYGKLAAEDLGRPVLIPPPPSPLTAAERAAAVQTAGLDRALELIAMGLRSEGVREWNFTLRGMNDRQLLAAAQWACDREVWDRCINTSDRTKTEVDLTQRFPMPFRKQVTAQAAEIGLDPAYVYGLIRQESRFIMDARSGVGASGLMQVMPATARWTARKIGLPFRAEQITDRDVNIKIGTSYLKLVLDDFGGSQAMGAAAYNAGPSRPRRWRQGPSLEAAIWAENIPFSETRDYVKKVLSNATYYAALIHGDTPSLKARLGAAIGPREERAEPVNGELP